MVDDNTVRMTHNDEKGLITLFEDKTADLLQLAEEVQWIDTTATNLK